MNRYQSGVDKAIYICYSTPSNTNLKESEVVIIMSVKRTEIVTEYGVKTSVCAF